MVRAPLHFHGRIPVPEVAPLTYRDSVTHLELVYELSEYLKNILHPSLQSTVDKVVADAEQLLSDANAQYVDGVEEFQRIHDRFMSDVNAHLVALNDTAVADLLDDRSSLVGQALHQHIMHAVPRVNVTDHGATEDEDNTRAFNTAADYAREHGLPIYVPPGTWRIQGQVNWRYLDILAEGNIRIDDQTAQPSIVVGDTSARRPSRSIVFADVTHNPTPLTDTEFPNPALRVVGLKGSYVKVAAVSWLQFYADADVREDDSIAYNTIETQRVNHLEIVGHNGQGWINENLFQGGSHLYTHIHGTYVHNNNKFEKVSQEGSNALIRVDRGSANVWEDVRSEAGMAVEFGGGARHNVVSSLFLSNPNVLDGGVRVNHDHGQENIVTSRMFNHMREHVVVSMNSGTTHFDTASEVAHTDRIFNPTPGVGAGKLQGQSGGQHWFDTGVMPVVVEPTVFINRTYTPLSKVDRLILWSDERCMRPRIYLYDKNGVLISNNGYDLLAQTPSLSDSVDGGYYTSALVNSVTLVIQDPRVHYIRVRVSTSGYRDLFSHITLSAFLPEYMGSAVVDMMRQHVQKPLYGTGQPTQGTGKPGTVVIGDTESWKVVRHGETFLTTASSSAQTLDVDDTAGMSSGDVIGVLLDNGHTHWTTISSVNSQQVTLTERLPSLALYGAPVESCGWVTV